MERIIVNVCLVFGISIATSIMASIIVKMSIRATEKNAMELHTKLIDDTFKMLDEYSVNNAGIVNNSMSSPNSPVRPKDETFYDGIMNIIKEKSGPGLPESKLMNIRSFVLDNYAEVANELL